jgi:hypothetical protein
MRMAYYHSIYFINGDGKGVPIACLFAASTLDQSTLQHDGVLRGPQQVQRASHLFRRTKKLQRICHWTPPLAGKSLP